MWVWEMADCVSPWCQSSTEEMQSEPATEPMQSPTSRAVSGQEETSAQWEACDNDLNIWEENC